MFDYIDIYTGLTLINRCGLSKSHLCRVNYELFVGFLFTALDNKQLLYNSFINCLVTYNSAALIEKTSVIAKIIMTKMLCLQREFIRASKFSTYTLCFFLQQLICKHSQNCATVNYVFSYY